MILIAACAAGDSFTSAKDDFTCKAFICRTFAVEPLERIFDQVYIKLVRRKTSALHVMPFLTFITSYTVVSFFIYSNTAFRTNTGHESGVRWGDGMG